MKMSGRKLARIGLISAVYVVVTVLASSISYGPLQFRVSNLLKGFALLSPDYVWGLAIGTFVSNLFSPYAGPMELVLMPAICWVFGMLAYRIRRFWYVAMLVYAAAISLGVGVVLHVALGLPVLVTLGPVFVSEAILYELGGLIVRTLSTRINVCWTEY